MKNKLLLWLVICVLMVALLGVAGCADKTKTPAEIPDQGKTPETDETPENPDPQPEDPSCPCETVYEEVGIAYEDAYFAKDWNCCCESRRKHFVFVPQYTSDYDIKVGLGATGSWKINGEMQYKASEGRTELNGFRMEKGKEYKFDIKYDDTLPNYGLCISPRKGFEGLTLQKGEEYMFSVTIDRLGVTRLLLNNDNLSFVGVNQANFASQFDYLSCLLERAEFYYLSKSFSNQVDIVYSNPLPGPPEGYFYVVIKNLSEEPQCVEITEGEVRKIRPGEIISISSETDGKGPYFFEYTEEEGGTKGQWRYFILSDEKFHVKVISFTDGEEEGGKEKNTFWFVTKQGDRFCIGFVFDKDGTFTIQMNDTYGTHTPTEMPD